MSKHTNTGCDPEANIGNHMTPSNHLIISTKKAWLATLIGLPMICLIFALAGGAISAAVIVPQIARDTANHVLTESSFNVDAQLDVEGISSRKVHATFSLSSLGEAPQWHLLSKIDATGACSHVLRTGGMRYQFTTPECSFSAQDVSDCSVSDVDDLTGQSASIVEALGNVTDGTVALADNPFSVPTLCVSMNAPEAIASLSDGTADDELRLDLILGLREEAALLASSRGGRRLGAQGGCCQRNVFDTRCAGYEYVNGVCTVLSRRSIGCNRGFWQSNKQYDAASGRCVSKSDKKSVEEQLKALVDSKLGRDVTCNCHGKTWFWYTYDKTYQLLGEGTAGVWVCKPWWAHALNFVGEGLWTHIAKHAGYKPPCGKSWEDLTEAVAIAYGSAFATKKIFG